MVVGQACSWPGFHRAVVAVATTEWLAVILAAFMIDACSALALRSARGEGGGDITEEGLARARRMKTTAAARNCRDDDGVGMEHVGAFEVVASQLLHREQNQQAHA